MESLLGLRVSYRGLKLGAVAAVVVDGSGCVLGVEVADTFGDTQHFLPWPAAALSDDGVEAGPLPLLSVEDADFYLRRGARRVVAVEAQAAVDVSPSAVIG